VSGADATTGGWFREREHELALVQLESTPVASPWRDAWRRLRARPAARRSLRALVVLAVLSFLCPLLPLPSPVAMRFDRAAHPPDVLLLGEEGYGADDWKLGAFDRALVAVRVAAFGEFQTAPWLGTDAKGRDVLSRILWGGRTSLLVALCAALTSLTIGVAWGAVSGLAGRRVDNAMMRFVDVLQSVPTIFVVIFLLSVLHGPRRDLTDEPLLSREAVFFLVIGAVSWLSLARVVRGQVLSLRESAFVQAARVQGASTLRIVRTHVWPNVASLVVVYVALSLPSVILYEAFLSFLGLGVEPPGVSWGLLAADAAEAISPLGTDWWRVAFPSLAIGGTLLALGFLGDGLRDALDARGEGRR
jgi:oligopeptide transport system permease protein